MSWDTAIADVRSTISDGATDKLHWRKKCLGVSDGTNLNFKTIEKRRLSSLVTPTAPVGVWVNDVAATVDSEDLTSGQFTLHTAPAVGSRVEANYYTQWFTDAQLDTFLRFASNFMGLGDTYANIPGGLQPSALKYAAADAYQELALRFVNPLSDQFTFGELSAEKLKVVVDGYQKMSAQFRKEAGDLRKGYYTRQNEPDSPIFDSISGGVRDVEPNA